MLKKMLCFVFVFTFCSLSISAQDGAIDEKLLQKFESNVNTINNIDQLINMVTNNSIKDISLNHEKVISHNELYSHKLKKTGITDQASSGRCWAFAGNNLLSSKVMTDLQFSEFEMSESFIAFYDKLEKGNFFLERIIEMRDRPLDDRSLQNELSGMFGDGGWHNYFLDIVKKYGMVPKEIMPETKQSASTGMLNNLGQTLLRSYASELLQMHKDGKKLKALRARKDELLGELYHFLVLNYGKPPKSFVYRYEFKDKDDTTKTEKQIIEKEYTPKSFFDTYFGSSLPEYVAIVNNPAMEFNKAYLLKESRNIYENSDFTVINLPIEDLKNYARKSILDSQAVWFACDIGKDNYRNDALLKTDIYDYSKTLGIDFSLSKRDRILYHDMSPNHAMVLTGLDTAQTGETVKWLVENSWGKKAGDDGYWNMYDDWFSEYILLIVVDKNLLSDEHKKLFDSKPQIIADWEPFFLALKHLEY